MYQKVFYSVNKPKSLLRSSRPSWFMIGPWDYRQLSSVKVMESSPWRDHSEGRPIRNYVPFGRIKGLGLSSRMISCFHSRCLLFPPIPFLPCCSAGFPFTKLSSILTALGNMWRSQSSSYEIIYQIQTSPVHGNSSLGFGDAFRVHSSWPFHPILFTLFTRTFCTGLASTMLNSTMLHFYNSTILKYTYTIYTHCIYIIYILL